MLYCVHGGDTLHTKKESFKNRLAQALSANNMKAVDLCERTGIPKSAISYYLAGKSEPRADRVQKISAALGVNEPWLLGYDAPMARTAEQKKNDAIVDAVLKMQDDAEFFKVVSDLAELDAANYESIKRLISALRNK